MKIVWKKAGDLRAHDLHQMYGPPVENSEFENLKVSIRRHGWQEDKPASITDDDVLIIGRTRHYIVRRDKDFLIPCVIFQPKNPATKEAEVREAIVIGNMYRQKSELTITKEMRVLMEVERELGRQRMGRGRQADDTLPSKSSDRVGLKYKLSGKTVQKRLKVLDAIESAHAKGNQKREKQLAELLEAKKVDKAFAIVKGEPAAAKKPPKVEVPPTLLGHANKAHSEFFEALAKVTVPDELAQVETFYRQVGMEIERVRRMLLGNAVAEAKNE
jgi:hypothetical protein